MRVLSLKWLLALLLSVSVGSLVCPTPNLAVAQEPAADSGTAETRDMAGEEAKLLTLVNAERAKTGVAALSLSTELNAAAQRHSKDMAANKFLSHTGSDGSTAEQRTTEAGYKWGANAENIAQGSTTAAAAMQQWMESTGHRKNILSGEYEHVGFAVEKAAGGDYYWTQVFGRPL
jgi:uncharacterized protein YkwD